MSDFSFLSQRSQLLCPSATLAMTAKAAERRRQGLPVYNLSVGEPDFGTPDFIRQAAKEAIDAGFTFYTAVGGIPELKRAIADKFQRDQGIRYEPGQITCSNGGKQILYNFFQVVLDPGDEVILADPNWLSYQSQVELAGGVCRFVATSPEEGFAMKADHIKPLISSKTKVLVLNSPSNPTGAIISPEDLKVLAALAREHRFLILSDDVYEFFYYGDEPPAHILKIAPDLMEQVVMVNSVSKTYAMTGWRLGYAGGPHAIIGKMEELQSQSASNPSSISQKAALAALNGPQDSVERMRQSFLSRRALVAERLTQARVRFVRPEGAFYFMMEVTPVLKAEEDDEAFCQRLLETTGVTMVPGRAFGSRAAGWVRMSFAVSDEVLEQAIEKFVACYNA